MRRSLVTWSAVFAVVALAVPAAAQTPAPAPTPAAAAPAVTAAPKLADTELAAPKGMTLKVGDSAWLKFGGMFQAWADWNQDPATEGYIQNLFVQLTGEQLGGPLSYTLAAAPPTSSWDWLLTVNMPAGAANEYLNFDWTAGNPNVVLDKIQAQSIPEPGTLTLLLGLGSLGLLGRSRRRRKLKQRESIE